MNYMNYMNKTKDPKRVKTMREGMKAMDQIKSFEKKH